MGWQMAVGKGILIAAFVLCAATSVRAWWSDGHAVMTEAAVLALPLEVPAFFRAGGQVAAHLSIDADVFKNRRVPTLDNAEYSEHFFNIEYLQGRSFPARRYDFIELCQQLGLDPQRVGFAPYAIVEWTGRLTAAFAEYRRWPEDESIRYKCLVYAGFIAHYAEDLCQPLHATVHHNGKIGADGTAVGKGIHERVDSAPGRLGFTAQALALGQEVAAFDSLIAGVVDQVVESNSRVQAVYDLLGRWDNADDGQMRALVEERSRRAVHFTASLYLTAWRNSEDICLPSWLRR